MMKYSNSEIIKGLSENNRVIIGKALSLVESNLAKDKKQANNLLKDLPKKDSVRIGITGSPGSGKSTMINAYGQFLIEKGHRVAVLTVDPSSTFNKGSILGDKTRMPDLAKNENAFIRPSASSGVLGGLANSTYEMIRILEAANYDYILIESVGVGQSEIDLINYVDLFTLLVLPNSGDEIQGLKKGIMEVADIILISKAEDSKEALKSKSNLEFSLKVIDGEIEKKVILFSSFKKVGFEEFYSSCKEIIKNYKAYLEKRNFQEEKWLKKKLENDLISYFIGDPILQNELNEMKNHILKGEIEYEEAFNDLIKNFGKKNKS